jgi:starvation-inducible DNA-binding protein
MNYLGIDKQNAMNVVDRLNDLLSNYHVYYQNLRNFHWNIQGENFFDLHEKFEELYDDARTKIDEIAERILTLRLRPLSKMSDYLDRSDIKEAGEFQSDYEMVEEILKNHRIIIENMRAVIDAADDIDDEGTIDMIGGFLAELEKTSWMLDAWKVRTKKTVDA